MVEQTQAIKDMIDFIAEFELWLEAEVADLRRLEEDELTHYDNGCLDEIVYVHKNYRRCKQRIQYDDNR